MKRITLPLMLLFAASTCFAQMYTITDLGALPGSIFSFGYGINDAGQVVGYSETAGGNRHAFLWSNGSMQDLGTLPGATDSIARSINNAGQIVGTTSNANIGYHAFLWTNGSMQDLGTFPGGFLSEAHGINATGQVVGDSNSLTFGSHPFLYANGSMQDLGILPGGPDGAQAFGINSAGHVVGYSSAYVYGDYFGTIHAFLWSNGSMQDLGTLPGGTYSQAWGINDAEQVVGWAGTAGGIGNEHAFLWSNGSMQDLGTLPGASASVLFAINNAGQAVGQSTTAMLFANGSLRDLNTLIPASSGWSLGAAFGINASGQITGIGVSPAGYSHAFLLTPNTPYKAFVQQPINVDGSSIFRANRGVVPVKFTLTENNTPTCALQPATISVTRTAGGTLGAIDESAYTMAADSGSNFRIDPTACQYIYNIAASSLGVGTYRVDISMNGIMIGHAVFALK